MLVVDTLEFGPESPSEQIIEGPEVRVRFSQTPLRYFRHGWQSWSLAAWTDAAHPAPIPKPTRLHVSEHDPVHALRSANHGSWVGAAEVEPGAVLLLGSLGLDAHVGLEGDALTGAYEAGTGRWFLAYGEERAVFARYAAVLGASLEVAPKRPVPRVWCSWYGLYEEVDEELMSGVVRGLGDLPFDVIQVDDGWQAAVGDWETNAKFPSGMEALATRIRAAGRRAGLWLAPLLAVRSSRLFREHADWFLRDESGRPASAGFNWAEPLYALDTTHPAVQAWLAGLMRRVRSWGFDYLKLDFLYAGALPGRRRVDLPREQAYRQALSVLRDTIGDEAYLVAVGAPILPSIGLCDALRVGPDVAPHWETHRDAVLLQNPAIPGVRNAIRTVLHRLWLQPLVQLDPDVVYFRSTECNLTPHQKHLLQGLALICGFKATSDLPQWLTSEQRTQLRAFLESRPHIEQRDAWHFLIDGQHLDYREAALLPGGPKGLDVVMSAGLGWLANRTWALRVDHELNHKQLRAKTRRIKREHE